MLEETTLRARDSDVVIMAAAVADFTAATAREKIKKNSGALELSLTPTVDILLELVRERRADQVIVGFAAESNNVAAHALEKLRHKGVDLLVVNDVSSPGAGFEHSTNEVTLLDRHETATMVSLRSKEAVSLEILTRVASLLSQGAR